jgi:peptidoglycan/xylan/chitin deacetylase (PgdA/CDA1 family)
MTMRHTVPVLLYHSVCTDPAPLMKEWSITPDAFREHLAFLASEGYETLTVTEYAERLRAPAWSSAERVALITFDDGFADFATEVAPALADAGMKGTLYVSTAYVGGRSTWLGPDGEQDMLDWTQINDLYNAGIEIGAHAHRHLALDELDRATAQIEIVQSKNLLEDQLGTRIDSFAYPHGYHSRALQEMVRLAGFTSACGVKHALSGPGDDLYALARIMVPGDASAHDLGALMHNLHRAPRHERVQTKAWRTVRRARARRSPQLAAGRT